ncbi:MAG: hypothetical protein LBE82_01755 [Chitinophagaceae bacterium]|nr:hypothetical protein [Chitinophagaceae bacterium]
MKKSTVAAMLGMAAMFAGATGVATSAEATASQDTQSRTNDKQAPMKSANPITMKKVNPFSGYDALLKGEGIPPKIYGMFHVKRGTHKKTNK